MEESGISKDLGADKKDERGRGQPVRIRELLGIPMSSGKSQLSQPVLVKDIFRSMSSGKAKQSYPSERRMTLANGKATKVRRQLYEASLRATPDRALSTNADRPERRETIAAGLDGNAGIQAGSSSVMLGVSKSEGKPVMNGPGLRQPERVKHLVESWEKSQTVKRQAGKSVMGDLGATKARRRLYNAPSALAAPRIVRKSLAPSRLQNPRKSTAVQRTSVKPDAQKSSQTQPRSCLLARNFIRDEHVNRRQKEIIKEESPASLLNEGDEQKSSISKKAPKKNERVTPEEKIEIENGETVKNCSPEERSASDDERIDEAAPQRPTVIMAASSTRKISSAKKFTRSARSSDAKKSPFALSRASFAQLDLKSFPKHRLDAASSSIEDLLGNSRPVEPSIGNLACNSTDLEQRLTTNNSRVSVDQQTFRWMHASLKLVIQSTEEKLFAMKKILRALDDLVDDASTVSGLPTAPRYDEEILSAARIEQTIAEKIDDPSEIPVTVAGRCFDESAKIDDPSEIPVTVVGKCFDESAKIDDSSEIPVIVVERCFDESAKIDDSPEIPASVVGRCFDESAKIDDSPEIPVSVVGRCFDESAKIDDSPEIPVSVVERSFDEPAKIDDLPRAESEPDEDDNKENLIVEKSSRRRSAGFVAMGLGRSSKSSDDSFSEIEKELNIVHEQPKAATPRFATPRGRKTIDPRSKRSMREYMALKSMVNCLQTPDAKGAATPKEETKDLTNQRRAKRSISRTLMNELEDLYADSPL